MRSRIDRFSGGVGLFALLLTLAILAVVAMTTSPSRHNTTTTAATNNTTTDVVGVSPHSGVTIAVVTQPRTVRDVPAITARNLRRLTLDGFAPSPEPRAVLAAAHYAAPAPVPANRCRLTFPADSA